MEETREFDSAALASLVGDRLMTNFPDVHEAAEFIAGHPIWTHEFVDRDLMDEIRASIIAQHPRFGAYDNSDVTRDNVGQRVAELRAKYGDTLSVKRGNRVRARGPIESAAEIFASGGE